MQKPAATAIKTCLFDMGNVLVFIDEERKNRAVAAELGLTPAESNNVLLTSSLQWRYEAGAITTAEFHASLLAAARRPSTADGLSAAFCAMFRVNDAMPPLLENLQTRGIRLVLVSNTNSLHFDYLRPRLPALNFFDAFVLSHEVKAMKPDAPFYQHAANQAETAPGAALFIDDMPANVEGAAKFGFQTHQFTPTAAGQTALAKYLEKLGVLPSLAQ